MDPFASTADPALYLPREATESALERLEAGLRSGARVQVLSGPAGLGKTLLLHVLAARVADAFRPLYLPYASLGWQDLCAWILGLLGEPPGAFPDRELLASARRSALHGRPLLLLVDEASGMPPDSAAALAELVEEADGALRLLLVPVDDARAGRMLALLARDVEELRLSAPLTLEETERYLRTRLVRGDVDFALQRRFDADTVATLHRLSGGNPRRLHHLAGEVLRGNRAALPGSEAREALGAVPSEGDLLEIDGAAGESAFAHAMDDGEPTEPALRSAAAPVPQSGSAPAQGDSASARRAPAAARGGSASAPQAAPASTSDSSTSAGTRESVGHPLAPAPERSAPPPPEPPLGPPDPERTNWWFVGAINLAILIGLLAGLYYADLLPPP